MKFHRNTRILRVQWDAAPISGLFFILILFVLLESSLVFTPGVTIELPVGNNLPGITGPRVSLGVDSAGKAYFENQQMSDDQLKLRLKDAAKLFTQPVSLVVLADKSVPATRMVQLQEIARDSGFAQFHWATRPPVSQPPVSSAK